MLEELLDLRKPHIGSVGHIPQTAAGMSFLALLDTEGDAFEEASLTIEREIVSVEESYARNAA